MLTDSEWIGQCLVLSKCRWASDPIERIRHMAGNSMALWPLKSVDADGKSRLTNTQTWEKRAMLLPPRRLRLFTRRPRSSVRAKRFAFTFPHLHSQFPFQGLNLTYFLPPPPPLPPLPFSFSSSSSSHILLLFLLLLLPLFLFTSPSPYHFSYIIHKMWTLKEGLFLNGL